MNDYVTPKFSLSECITLIRALKLDITTELNNESDRIAAQKVLGKIRDAVADYFVEHGAFCTHCGEKTPYNIRIKPRRITVKGVTFDFPEEIAICHKCGKQVYVPDVNDRNAEMRERAYAEELNIRKAALTKDQVEECRMRVEPYLPHTQYDRLKKMPLEVYAYELAHITECPRCPARREHCGADCHQAWLDWLNGEVVHGR